jgi:hypothetical protein
MAAQVYDNGKVVGQAVGGTFIKRVRGSKHMLRRPKAAWSFGVESLQNARKAGCKKVKVVDQESGQIYEVALDLLERDGFTFDRGYGQQVALPLDRWTRPGQAVQARLV